MKLIKIAHFATLLFSLPIFANESNRAHLKSVSIISATQTDNGTNVFSAGKDGFLIKWKENNLGEHYQVSEYSVQNIAQSPNGNDVAVYETDGALFNRVSVWDWQKQRRRFAFRFNESITSLSFSAKGTHLIVGTAAQNAIYIINSASGKIEPRKIKDNIANFSYAATGESEKTLVTYSMAGSISYYDLNNGNQKAKFDVESGLSDSTMFANSLFLAGTKGRNVVVVHALSGKTVGRFNAGNAIIVHSSSKQNELFYIVNENRQFKLYSLGKVDNRNVSEPKLLRTYSGLKSGDKITSATYFDGIVYAGTENGNVYKFDTFEMERVEVLQPITDDQYDIALDVSAVEDDCFILTPDSIFRSSIENDTIDLFAQNSNGRTNVASHGTDAILWSRGTRKSVLRVGVDSETTIFTPQGVLQSLRVFDDQILTVESGTTVNRYDFSGKRETLYTGAGLQDALLLTPTDLYVAKTAATDPTSPLIHVDTQTQEIVPLPLAGSFAYALTADSSHTNEIYGIVVSSNGAKQTTQVFSFDIQNRNSRTFVPVNEEDTDGFLSISFPTLYTNIKSQAHSYNVANLRDSVYARGESMSQKIVKAGNRIVILNRNGSVSWYSAETAKILSTWYLNADGKWVNQ